MTARDAPARPDGPLKIHVLSGGTGRTAEEVVQAALAQFDDVAVAVIVRGQIRSVKAARDAVRRAAADGGLLCHTLVVPRIRAAVIREAQLHLLPTVDVLGPILALLSDALGVPPRGQAGRSYQLHKERFDRLDAVDFAAAHDDGLRAHELNRADVVLVGVSRVSKSVTCFYLASHGIRAANVPLLLDRPVPEDLLRLDPRKVIGLTMNVARLSQIRAARLPHLGTAQLDKYAGDDHVRNELRYALRLMARYRWRHLDISYQSVEEVAQEIVSLLR